MTNPSNIEKESLEAHVEICAVRYANLETKLTNLEQRIEKLELYLVSIKDKLEDKLDERNRINTGYIISILGVFIAAVLGYIGRGFIG